jgi:hypothetical protein
VVVHRAAMIRRKKMDDERRLSGPIRGVSFIL